MKRLEFMGRSWLSPMIASRPPTLLEYIAVGTNGHTSACSSRASRIQAAKERNMYSKLQCSVKHEFRKQRQRSHQLRQPQPYPTGKRSSKSWLRFSGLKVILIFSLSPSYLQSVVGRQQTLSSQQHSTILFAAFFDVQLKKKHGMDYPRIMWYIHFIFSSMFHLFWGNGGTNITTDWAETCVGSYASYAIAD